MTRPVASRWFVMRGLVAVALGWLVVLPGCGGDKQSGSSNAQPTSAAPRTACTSPIVGAPSRARLRTFARGTTIPLDLRKAGGPNARVVVTPLTQRAVEKVRNRFGGYRYFVSPAGFLAVEYKIRNLGPASIEPSRDINRLTVLAIGVQAAIRPADRLRGCSTAPASYAKTQRLDGTESPIAGGDTATTVALFALPYRSTRQVWESAAFSFRASAG